VKDSYPTPWFFDESWNWVTWHIFVWLFPLLCGLGAIVNAGAFFVIATNRKVFPYVTRQYMLVITMNDFLILTFKAATHYLLYMSYFVRENAWTWYRTPRNVSFPLCIVYDFLTYYALGASESEANFDARKRSWFLALITAMALLLPILYVSNRDWNAEFNVCDIKSLNYVLNIYNPFDLYFGRVFLLSALIIGTAAICLLLVWNNRSTKRMQLEAGTDTGKGRHRSLIRITLILVFLNVTFLVTALPWSIVSQLHVHLEKSMGRDPYMILLRHLNTVVYANNALNWPIYFMGRNFRAAFASSFLPKWLGKAGITARCRLCCDKNKSDSMEKPSQSSANNGNGNGYILNCDNLIGLSAILGRCHRVILFAGPSGQQFRHLLGRVAAGLRQATAGHLAAFHSPVAFAVVEAELLARRHGGAGRMFGSQAWLINLAPVPILSASMQAPGAGRSANKDDHPIAGFAGGSLQVRFDVEQVRIVGPRVGLGVGDQLARVGAHVAAGGDELPGPEAPAAAVVGEEHGAVEADSALHNLESGEAAHLDIRTQGHPSALSHRPSRQSQVTMVADRSTGRRLNIWIVRVERQRQGLGAAGQVAVEQSLRRASDRGSGGCGGGRLHALTKLKVAAKFYGRFALLIYGGGIGAGQAEGECGPMVAVGAGQMEGRVAAQVGLVRVAAAIVRHQHRVLLAQGYGFMAKGCLLIYSKREDCELLDATKSCYALEFWYLRRSAVTSPGLSNRSAARCNSDRPSRSTRCGLAPQSSRRTRQSAWPLSAAHIAGVQPPRSGRSSRPGQASNRLRRKLHQPCTAAIVGVGAGRQQQPGNRLAALPCGQQQRRAPAVVETVGIDPGGQEQLGQGHAVGQCAGVQQTAAFALRIALVRAGSAVQQQAGRFAEITGAGGPPKALGGVRRRPTGRHGGGQQAGVGAVQDLVCQLLLAVRGLIVVVVGADAAAVVELCGSHCFRLLAAAGFELHHLARELSASRTDQVLAPGGQVLSAQQSGRCGRLLAGEQLVQLADCSQTDGGLGASRHTRLAGQQLRMPAQAVSAAPRPPLLDTPRSRCSAWRSPRPSGPWRPAGSDRRLRRPPTAAGAAAALALTGPRDRPAAAASPDRGCRQSSPQRRRQEATSAGSGTARFGHKRPRDAGRQARLPALQASIAGVQPHESAALASSGRPDSSSDSRPACPCRARVCAGVRPLRAGRSACPGSAASRSRTQAGWPTRQARCSGVQPSLLTRPGRAPCDSSRRSIGSNGLALASISGVQSARFNGSTGTLRHAESIFTLNSTMLNKQHLATRSSQSAAARASACAASCSARLPSKFDCPAKSAPLASRQGNDGVAGSGMVLRQPPGGLAAVSFGGFAGNSILNDEGVEIALLSQTEQPLQLTAATPPASPDIMAIELAVSNAYCVPYSPRHRKPKLRISCLTIFLLPRCRMMPLRKADFSVGDARSRIVRPGQQLGQAAARLGREAAHQAEQDGGQVVDSESGRVAADCSNYSMAKGAHMTEFISTSWCSCIEPEARLIAWYIKLRKLSIMSVLCPIQFCASASRRCCRVRLAIAAADCVAVRSAGVKADKNLFGQVQQHTLRHLSVSLYNKASQGADERLELQLGGSQRPFEQVEHGLHELAVANIDSSLSSLSSSHSTPTCGAASCGRSASEELSLTSSSSSMRCGTSLLRRAALPGETGGGAGLLFCMAVNSQPNSFSLVRISAFRAGWLAESRCCCCRSADSAPLESRPQASHSCNSWGVQILSSLLASAGGNCCVDSTPDRQSRMAEPCGSIWALESSERAAILRNALPALAPSSPPNCIQRSTALIMSRAAWMQRTLELSGSLGNNEKISRSSASLNVLPRRGVVSGAEAVQQAVHPLEQVGLQYVIGVHECVANVFAVAAKFFAIVFAEFGFGCFVWQLAFAQQHHHKAHGPEISGPRSLGPPCLAGSHAPWNVATGVAAEYARRDGDDDDSKSMERLPDIARGAPPFMHLKRLTWNRPTRWLHLVSSHEVSSSCSRYQKYKAESETCSSVGNRPGASVQRSTMANSLWPSRQGIDAAAVHLFRTMTSAENLSEICHNPRYACLEVLLDGCPFLRRQQNGAELLRYDAQQFRQGANCFHVSLLRFTTTAGLDIIHYGLDNSGPMVRAHVEGQMGNGYAQFRHYSMISLAKPVNQARQSLLFKQSSQQAVGSQRLQLIDETAAVPPTSRGFLAGGAGAVPLPEATLLHPDATAGWGAGHDRRCSSCSIPTAAASASGRACVARARLMPEANAPHRASTRSPAHCSWPLLASKEAGAMLGRQRAAWVSERAKEAARRSGRRPPPAGRLSGRRLSAGGLIKLYSFCRLPVRSRASRRKLAASAPHSGESDSASMRTSRQAKNSPTPWQTRATRPEMNWARLATSESAKLDCRCSSSDWRTSCFSRQAQRLDKAYAWRCSTEVNKQEMESISGMEGDSTAENALDDPQSTGSLDETTAITFDSTADVTATESADSPLFSMETTAAQIGSTKTPISLSQHLDQSAIIAGVVIGLLLIALTLAGVCLARVNRRRASRDNGGRESASRKTNTSSSREPNPYTNPCFNATKEEMGERSNNTEEPAKCPWLHNNWRRGWDEDEALNVSPPAQFLPASRTPAVPWNRWLDAFDFYCQAAQIWTPRPAGEEALTDEARRLATVCKNHWLHLLGFEGQWMARARNAIADGHTFWQTRDQLTTVFGDRPNVMVARHRFREQQQLPGEDAVTFVAALRELSATCSYGPLADEMIRDQLAQKTSSTRIRERLLMEDAARLTLEQADVIATTIEDAAAGSKAMAATSSFESVQTVQQAARRQGPGSAPPDSRVELQLGDCLKTVSLMVDCGAKVSLLNEATARSLSDIDLKPSAVQLRAYGRKKIAVAGLATVCVKYRSQELQHDFHITRSGENIVRRDLMQKLGIQVQLHLLQPRDANIGIANVDIASEFPAVFDGSIGLCRGAVHQPRINTAVPPVQQPLRRLPLAEQQQVGEELDAAGITERLNRSLMDSIRASRADNVPMQDALLQFLESYRSTPHTLTGKSPAELMLGRRWRTPMSLLAPVKNAAAAQLDIAKRIQQRQQRTAAYTDQRRGAQQPTLRTGDWVRIRRPTLWQTAAPGTSKRWCRHLCNQTTRHLRLASLIPSWVSKSGQCKMEGERFDNRLLVQPKDHRLWLCDGPLVRDVLCSATAAWLQAGRHQLVACGNGICKDRGADVEPPETGPAAVLTWSSRNQPGLPRPAAACIDPTQQKLEPPGPDRERDREEAESAQEGGIDERKGSHDSTSPTVGLLHAIFYIGFLVTHGYRVATWRLGFPVTGAGFVPTCTIRLAQGLFEYIYCMHSSFGLLWFPCWLLLVHETPELDPAVSDAEKLIIKEGRDPVGEHTKAIPWRTIFTSGPVLFCILGGILADAIIDKSACSLTVVRKAFTGFGFGLEAACCYALSGVQSGIAAVLLLNLGVGASGVTVAGWQVNHLDLAPQFASLLIGISASFGTLGGILSSIVIGAMTQPQTLWNWQKPFILTGSVLTGGVVVYSLLGSGELQPWAMKAGEGVTDKMNDVATKEPSSSCRKARGSKHSAPAPAGWVGPPAVKDQQQVDLGVDSLDTEAATRRRARSAAAAINCDRAFKLNRKLLECHQPPWPLDFEQPKLYVEEQYDEDVMSRSAHLPLFLPTDPIVAALSLSSPVVGVRMPEAALVGLPVLLERQAAIHPLLEHHPFAGAAGSRRRRQRQRLQSPASTPSAVNLTAAASVCGEDTAAQRSCWHRSNVLHQNASVASPARSRLQSTDTEGDYDGPRRTGSRRVSANEAAPGSPTVSSVSGSRSEYCTAMWSKYTLGRQTLAPRWDTLPTGVGTADAADEGDWQREASGSSSSSSCVRCILRKASDRLTLRSSSLCFLSRAVSSIGGLKVDDRPVAWLCEQMPHILVTIVRDFPTARITSTSSMITAPRSTKSNAARTNTWSHAKPKQGSDLRQRVHLYQEAEVPIRLRNRRILGRRVRQRLQLLGEVGGEVRPRDRAVLVSVHPQEQPLGHLGRGDIWQHGRPAGGAAEAVDASHHRQQVTPADLAVLVGIVQGEKPVKFVLQRAPAETAHHGHELLEAEPVRLRRLLSRVIKRQGQKTVEQQTGAIGALLLELGVQPAQQLDAQSGACGQLAERSRPRSRHHPWQQRHQLFGLSISQLDAVAAAGSRDSEAAARRASLTAKQFPREPANKPATLEQRTTRLGDGLLGVAAGGVLHAVAASTASGAEGSTLLGLEFAHLWLADSMRLQLQQQTPNTQTGPGVSRHNKTGRLFLGMRLSVIELVNRLHSRSYSCCDKEMKLAARRRKVGPDEVAPLRTAGGVQVSVAGTKRQHRLVGVSLLRTGRRLTPETLDIFDCSWKRDRKFAESERGGGCGGGVCPCGRSSRGELMLSCRSERSPAGGCWRLRQPDRTERPRRRVKAISSRASRTAPEVSKVVTAAALAILELKLPPSPRPPSSERCVGSEGSSGGCVRLPGSAGASGESDEGSKHCGRECRPIDAFPTGPRRPAEVDPARVRLHGELERPSRLLRPGQSVANAPVLGARVRVLRSDVASEAGAGYCLSAIDDNALGLWPDEPRPAVVGVDDRHQDVSLGGALKRPAPVRGADPQAVDADAVRPVSFQRPRHPYLPRVRADDERGRARARRQAVDDAAVLAEVGVLGSHVADYRPNAGVLLRGEGKVVCRRLQLEPRRAVVGVEDPDEQVGGGPVRRLLGLAGVRRVVAALEVQDDCCQVKTVARLPVQCQRQHQHEGAEAARLHPESVSAVTNEFHPEAVPRYKSEQRPNLMHRRTNWRCFVYVDNKRRGGKDRLVVVPVEHGDQDADLAAERRLSRIDAANFSPMTRSSFPIELSNQLQLVLNSLSRFVAHQRELKQARRLRHQRARDHRIPAGVAVANEESLNWGEYFRRIVIRVQHVHRERRRYGFDVAVGSVIHRDCHQAVLPVTGLLVVEAIKRPEPQFATVVEAEYANLWRIRLRHGDAKLLTGRPDWCIVIDVQHPDADGEGGGEAAAAQHISGRHAERLASSRNGSCGDLSFGAFSARRNMPGSDGLPPEQFTSE
uniref:G_PROTEIN_RECEP_F1_2 domain-containing protein n=1 Tax=Macrostomum lignano TaxID=282301 RepID=A0A1I8G5L2_9PLAT